MNPEIKSEWLARLRSGTIQQGKNTLAYTLADVSVGDVCTNTNLDHITPDEFRYCCLGVLAEMAAEQGVCSVNNQYRVVSNPDTPDDTTHGVTRNYGNHTGLLPSCVVNWAALPTKIRLASFYREQEQDFHPDGSVYLPIVDRQGNTVSLPDLNDDYDFTFSQIADLIEALL